MKLLQVEGLEVAYGGIEAVRGIDLAVDEGQVVALLGSNGAGKSSAVRAVCGLERSTGGSIMFDGRTTTRLPAYKVARRGIILVPEGRRVIAPLSVEDNVLLGAYRRKLSRRDSKREFDSVAELFPILQERRNSAAGLLSGGEQQMLVLARAMIGKPRLLVLDEPSMGLSPRIVRQVVQQIKVIAESGVPVLLVEQNAAAALEVSSYVYLLANGRIVAQGEPEEMLRQNELASAFGLGGTEA